MERVPYNRKSTAASSRLQIPYDDDYYLINRPLIIRMDVHFGSTNKSTVSGLNLAHL
jgi:hypothetical protein